MVHIRAPYIFQDLVQELDRMTRDVDWAFGGTAMSPQGPRSGLQIGEKEAVLELELPGVSEGDLQIELENGHLNIKAQRGDLHQESENVVLRERTFGEFRRRYRLPWPVHQDAIDARLQDGVLRLVLQRAPEAEPRRITVQRG
jgi:HSP20 family protein